MKVVVEINGRERRIHHGLVGCLFLLGGAILAFHDRNDAHLWLPELIHA